jgi:nucleotide-binding universal stress UspA family protein
MRSLGPWSLSWAHPARNDRGMSDDGPFPREREQPPTMPADTMPSDSTPSDLMPSDLMPSDSSAVAGSTRAGSDASPTRWTSAGGGVEPRRLFPLVPRRQTPRLLVEVDGSPASQGALIWALREAARREGTVVAVTVLDDPPETPLGAHSSRRDHAAALERIDAQVLRAIAETGVQGRARTSVIDRAVFEALTAAAHGADLVVVGPEGKTLLRPAVPRPPGRRLARGA